MTSTTDVARKPGGAKPSRRSAAPPERPSDHGHQPTIELPLMTASEVIASVAALFVQPRIEIGRGCATAPDGRRRDSEHAPPN